jgi:hypothetical protein
LIRAEIGALRDQPRDAKGQFSRSDNITTDRGTSPTYTLKRLKRDGRAGYADQFFGRDYQAGMRDDAYLRPTCTKW